MAVDDGPFDAGDVIGPGGGGMGAGGKSKRR